MPSQMNTNDSGFYLDHTISTNGDYKILLKTENKFVDKDIALTITTPSSSNPSLALTDATSALPMGNASDGSYYPTVTLAGNISVSTAGWISSGNHAVSQSGIKVGTIDQSIIRNENSTIASGSTVNPSSISQTIYITCGYNDERTIVIGPASAGPSGNVTSGSASITSTSIAYNSTNSNFDITGSANVSAPTVGTAGYVSSSVGTLSGNTNGATLSATLPKIGIQANLSGTGTKKPTISLNSSKTNITAYGTLTTTKPSTGYYIAVQTAANTDTVTATATVTSAGYGTITTGQYSTTDSSALTIGASASDITYVPLNTVVFANSATSGETYEDISSSIPALVFGDYLYINKGYIGNRKISLAQLIPDSSATNAAASYIVSGYTAYDNDGTLLVGTMATYAGAYEVV